MADIQVVKAAAFRLVELMQMDQAVRAASRLGAKEGPFSWEHNHVTGDGRRLMIRSTDGAGTNTADVWTDTPEAWQHISYGLSIGEPSIYLERPPALVVYSCNQYGRQLDVMRGGWWVPVVLALAWERICTETAAGVIAADQRAAKEALAFTPLPD